MFENAKEPKDMFDGIDTGAPNPTPPVSVPSSAKVTPPSPAAPVMPAMGMPAAAPMPALESASQGRRGIPWKPIVFVIAILLVIAAAGTISYFILASRTSPTASIPPAPEPSSEDTTQTPEPTPTPQPVITPPIVETPQDTDHDGLSDAQETQIGTSSTSSDTDADGLFDREEVEVYKTNPLNPDTDGDGYLDGAEVKAGYNPNGPGKLFDVPAGS